MSEVAPDANLTVSVEQDGRVLSGVGVTKEALQETIDARTPDDKPAESPSAAPAPVSDTAPADAGGQPKPTRGQARFSELTDKAKAAIERAEAAEKRAADAEARLNQAPQPQQAPPAAQRPVEQPQAPQTRPKPVMSAYEDEVGVDLTYKTYGAAVEAFTDAVDEWKQEQRDAAIDQRVRQGIEGYQHQRTVQSQIDGARVKGRAAYKDFDAVMNGPGAAATQSMPIAAQEFVWQQPNSEHLVYAILRDPALAQRLTWLSVTNPLAFGLELAKLAPAAPAALPASTGSSGSATPPPPMQPVGSGSTTTKLSSAEHARSGNYEAYKAARTAERGGRRR